MKKDSRRDRHCLKTDRASKELTIMESRLYCCFVGCRRAEPRSIYAKPFNWARALKTFTAFSVWKCEGQIYCTDSDECPWHDSANCLAHKIFIVAQIQEQILTPERIRTHIERVMETALNSKPTLSPEQDAIGLSLRTYRPD
jgi:hypothetical protein